MRSLHYKNLRFNCKLAAVGPAVDVGEVGFLGSGRHDVEGAGGAGAHQVGVDVGARHVGGEAEGRGRHGRICSGEGGQLGGRDSRRDEHGPRRR